MHRILDRLGNPQRQLPPVIHIAGTNGKGSTVAYLRAIGEAAGLRVHAYTSPHLVRFHERIRLAAGPGKSGLIAEDYLSALLEECETINGGEPITFFEITTAAAFLAFSRTPADFLLLEVGLGGRLDATNVVERPKVTAITMIDLDHQHYLGDSISLIAREKAGILKHGVVCVVGPQVKEAQEEIDRAALEAGAPLSVSGRDWSCFEQHGRLVFNDERGLLDLPRPQLKGRFQIDNAGIAIAIVRMLGEERIGEHQIGEGLRSVQWPARLQRLTEGRLLRGLTNESELWLDGGHNSSAGKAVAQALAEIEERSARPLVIVMGMLKTKDARSYVRSFKGLAQRIITVDIPGEDNSFAPEELAEIATREGHCAESAGSIEEAVRKAAAARHPVRILIGGSLYLAGHVLALNSGEAKSSVSGAAR
jgi:dihydrofolate synthase/folylpolyglutamate synthase